MVKRLLFIFYFILFAKFAQAQCPQIYDYLGNLSNRPYFVSCTGAPNYNMFLSSNIGWGAYTINWGDGTPDDAGASYTANSLINHTYNSASPDTFVITLTIPSLNCTLTGVAVMEKPVNASIQIPIGGVTTACAPKALQFINSSTDVSETTIFTWNFGDGTAAQTFDYTNAGQTVTHTYNKNTVNCQTAVTLTAKNYCTPVPTIANFNPIQIYDVDDAAISSSAFIKCWPDNVFTYTNTTNRNCVPQGNTFQRQEKWNLGNYWGMGHDSIIDWRPWPPTSPVSVAYPATGNYTVQLLDSNLCGVDVQNLTVVIVNPPTAGVTAPAGPFCAGAAVTFTNASATGYMYKWNFGAGGGFVSRPFGPQTYTYNTSGTYTVSVVALVSGGGAACTDTEKVVVNILPRPIANFTATPIIGCTQITNATFTDASTDAIDWNWNFGNGNTFNGLTPPAQNYTTTGSFVAALTVTAANTCTHTYTVPITVYQKPIALFSPTVACEGSVTSFTDNSTFAANNPITSWNWNFGDASPTATTSIQHPSHTYTANNTFSVQLIVNTAFCGDTIIQPITVHVKPTANFSLTPLNGCPSLTVNFTNSSSNADSYNWNFGNGNSTTTTDASEVFTNTLSTNQIYTITLTSITNVGCSDTKTATVNVFAKPKATFTVDAPAGCSPIIATFTNTSTGATSYQWSFGDNNFSTSTNTLIAHTYSNTTLLIQTYTAQLVATNGNGCKDSSNITVTAYPRPTFNFTMIPSSGCTPLSINFPPVLGAVTYEWDFGDGSPLDFSPNPTHVFTNTTSVSKTFTVELIATNAFSCIDTAYGYPVVFPKPVSNFTMSPTSACSPVNASFNNTSIAATTYTWNYGDGSAISTLINPPHTFTNTSLVSKTYTVELIASNAFACTDTSYFLTTILPKPTAAFTNTPNSGCSPLLITFNNSSTGATTYTWNYGDATSNDNSINASHSFTNTTLANITRTVNLYIENTFNCKDTALTSIIISPKPNVSFNTSGNNGCSPLITTFTNSSTGATTYTWSYGDGSPTSHLLNASHTFSTGLVTNETFTVQLSATNAFSCKDSVITTITVSPKPSAAFGFSPVSGCTPLPVTFNNTSVGATTYTWSFGDGSPVNTNHSPSYTFTNSTSANITYSTQLVVENTFGCKDTAQNIPLIFHKPIPNYTTDVNSGCSPVIVNFTNTSLQASAYNWKFGNGATDTQTNTVTTYTNDGAANLSYSCTLIAFTFNGCKDSITKTINVFNKPIADFTVDTPSCSPKILNFSNTSIGGASYHWDFGTATATSINATHQYVNTSGSTQTQTVQLIATSSNNCKDTITIPIYIHPKPEFAIIASPDSGCTDLSVNFPAIPGATAYQWNFGDGNSSSDVNPTNIFYNTTLTDKTYTVQLIATDVYGCKDTSSKVIKVFTKPTAQFQANPNTVFIPGSAVNCTNLSNGASSYLWNFGDNNTSSESNPTHFYTEAGEYQIYLVAISTKGCKDTFELPSKIIAILESDIDVPNAFTPNPNGGNGGVFDDKDLNNDVFHPVIKGVDKYELSIFSRWGELLFVSTDVKTGWDGYYKGKLCTQDVYIWKINATTIDGKKLNKTGDLLLLR